jgi:hypothetical protein
VNPEVAVAFAMLTHASNYILTTLTGLGFMVADGVSITSVRSAEVRSEVRDAKQANRAGRQVDSSSSTIGASGRLNRESLIQPLTSGNQS